MSALHVESVAIGFEDCERRSGPHPYSCRATSAGRRTTPGSPCGTAALAHAPAEAAGTLRPPCQIHLFRLVWLIRLARLVRFVWLLRLVRLVWLFRIHVFSFPASEEAQVPFGHQGWQIRAWFELSFYGLGPYIPRRNPDSRSNTAWRRNRWRLRHPRCDQPCSASDPCRNPERAQATSYRRSG